MTWPLHIVLIYKELTNSLFKGPNWLQNISRQAVMLYLLSYVVKELTNSLFLASDWLTISVCVIWLDKEIFIEKVTILPAKVLLLLQIFGIYQTYIYGMESFTINHNRTRFSNDLPSKNLKATIWHLSCGAAYHKNSPKIAISCNKRSS